MKPIFWKPKMLVCTLRGEGGGGLKKCTVCTFMKMLTFLDGPLHCTITIHTSTCVLEAAPQTIYKYLTPTYFRSF